jgi:tyrosinase
MHVLRLCGVAVASIALQVVNGAPTPADTQDAAATATVPVSPSTDTGVASDQFADLASYAANTTQQDLSAKKRGTCTLSNLRVRRQW